MDTTAKDFVKAPDLPGLTTLRALAALLVFGYHLGSAAPSRIFGIGYVGVAFFFVLSGFVLTWGSDPERSRRRFYLRRLARIYPSHLVVWLAVIVLPIEAGARDPLHAVLNLALLQAWSWRLSDVFSMNGVTWSLSCEMFFYAVFPFVYVASRRLGLRAQWLTVIGLFVLAGAVVCVGSFADPASPIALVAGADPLVRAPEFLLGVVGARTLQAGHRISVRHVVPVVVLGLAGSALVHGSPAEATWAAPVFLLVIMTVAQATVAGRRVLDWRWAVYCGKVSFCFYLVHQLVMKQVFADLGPGPIQGGLALVLACGLAVLLHHAVELPANRLILSRIVPARVAA